MSLLQPRILRELELAKFGFEVLPTDHLFVPFPDGRYFVFWDDLKKTCAEIAKFSKKDAETYSLVLVKGLEDDHFIARVDEGEHGRDHRFGGAQVTVTSLSGSTSIP